jgi:hypothetical protein
MSHSPCSSRWAGERKARRRLLLPVVLLGLAAGCARVPVEVRTAMEKQAAELELIRAKHRESIDVLFAQIRRLQLHILDELEKVYLEKYAAGPRVVKLQDNTDAVVYTDSQGRRLPPSYNPDVDKIAVSTGRIITTWFSQKREESEKELHETKAEFLKLQGHIEITQQINQAVTDYVDSLVNLRRKQKELGTALLKKLPQIPGAAGVQVALTNLMRFDTSALEALLPKPVGAPK